MHDRQAPVLKIHPVKKLKHVILKKRINLVLLFDYVNTFDSSTVIGLGKKYMQISADR